MAHAKRRLNSELLVRNEATHSPVHHRLQSWRSFSRFNPQTVVIVTRVGSAILHWDRSKDNLPNVILTADSIIPVLSGGVSVMYSYPNYIPLPPDEIHNVWKTVKSINFELMYGGWYQMPPVRNAKPTILKSLQQIVHVLTQSRSHAIFSETL